MSSPGIWNVARMLTLTFLLVILCAFPAAARAEGSFGFYGGINMAKMGGDIELFADAMAYELENEFGGDWTSENTTRSGIGFGAYYLNQFSPTVGLSIEAQYIERGTQLDISARNLSDLGDLPFDSVSGDIAFKLTYLEIPVLARFTGSPEGSFHPILLGGPVLSIETSSELEVTLEGVSGGMSMDALTKSTTFGLIVGAGFGLDMGETSSLVMQGRYYVGITPAIDEIIFSSSNSGLGIFAGMEFALGQ